MSSLRADQASDCRELGTDGRQEIIERDNADERTVGVNDRRAPDTLCIERPDRTEDAHVGVDRQGIAGHHVPDREAEEVGRSRELAEEDVAIGQDPDRAALLVTCLEDEQRTDVEMAHLSGCIGERSARLDGVNAPGAQLSDFHTNIPYR